ncbi:hypothetical protein M9Y10_031078 [Tritrichomonas musculus]|uniref:Leucine-rich repeat domain-containing protein n=1 Tax=Tritrichomonas musculus TaxID=1915356 RepID=A0ABR2H1Q5_9EUKA
MISSSVTAIGKEALFSCRSLIKIPLPNGLTKPKEGTFQYCESLKDINIPSSVIVIEVSCFEHW